MTYSASVTLEFPEAPPETVRVPIVAGNHRKAAWLAVDALLKAHPRRQPSSIVMVLEVERLRDQPSDGSEGDQSALLSHALTPAQ